MASKSYSHNGSHFYADGLCSTTPTTSDYMTGTADHICTDQCAHIHLSAQLREFEHRVQQLSMTRSVRGFIWYHNAVAAIFTKIWEGNSHA